MCVCVRVCVRVCVCVCRDGELTGYRRDNTVHFNETVKKKRKEGFRVVQGWKRRRTSSASSVAEVSKESMKKVFIKIETVKLNLIGVLPCVSTYQAQILHHWGRHYQPR